jgi:hypothetical protein
VSDEISPAFPFRAVASLDCVEDEMTAFYGVTRGLRARQRRALLRLERLLEIATRRAELGAADSPSTDSTSTVP